MNKQAGFAIVAAMFVLIIVGLLGKYLVNISGVHHKTTVLAVQSARAYHAAKSGIEWGIINSCTTSGSYSVNNFSVNITSTQETFDEAGVTITICRITSQAKYGIYTSADYVSRTLEVMINEI